MDDVIALGHAVAAVGEQDQDLVALALFQLAVQRQGGEALFAQVVGQFAALYLGVA